MKLLRLDLRAFGPFSEVVLDLAEGSHGLHLVFGPNEAGKSSALRALQQLFFGIPERPSDAFRHTYDKLRVGARVRHSDGSQLEFLRRKARTNTLRGADDQAVVDPSELARFLGGMDQGLFATMFGINHAALKRGGQEILRGGGQLGQLLFAAGSGIADLRAIQEGLKKDMEDLFKPAGKNQKITKALQDLRKAQETVREQQLSSEEWLRHDRALAEAHQKKEHLDSELQNKRRRHNRLARIRDALPVTARRQELLTELEPFRDAVLLPEDFPERRNHAQAALQSGAEHAAQAQTSLDHIREQLAGLDVPEALLARADDIEELHRRSGEYQKANKDKPRLILEGNKLEREAKEILRSLGLPAELEQAEPLRLRPDEPVTIQNLGNRHQGLLANVTNACLDRTRLDGRLQEARQELTGIEPGRDLADIRLAIRHAQQDGNLESELTDVQHKLEQADKLAVLERARLPLWSGTLDALCMLPVPAAETIDRFEADLTTASDHYCRLEDGLRQEETIQLEINRQIQQLELQQEVPSEEDLARARSRRDEGWRLVRQAWQEHDAPEPQIQGFLADSQAPGLAEAYEQSVHQADKVADRLRREADRVARKAELLAQLRQHQEHLHQQANLLEDAKKNHDDQTQQWHTLWSPLGIAPLPPREMRSWLRKQADVAARAQTCQSLRDQAEKLQQTIAGHMRSLASLLEKSAVEKGQANLADLIDLSQQVLDQADAAAQKRRQIERDIATCDKELRDARLREKRAEEELAGWQEQWTRAMARLRLNADAVPEAANAVLAATGKLFEKLEHADGFRRRLEGIERDVRDFSRDVKAVAEALLPGPAQADDEELMSRLYEELKAARAAQEKRQNHLSMEAHEVERLRQAQSKMAENTATLETMCRAACCSSIMELPAAAERSDRRRRLEKEICVLEEQLLNLRAGTALGDFLDEVSRADVDALETELHTLDDQVADLARQISLVDQAIGGERNELERMDGRASAAEAAELAEGLVAQVQADVQKYVTLRLAAGVLQKGIERYREKNQGPILERASRLFGELTVGSFLGLQVDYDDKGEPVLIGTRAADRQPVPVEGMSEGTCDQLYLALRLASLEAYLESHEPMPFIVDDILVNFDDQRALAALKALAVLSRQTQVIFFTHHQHLVDLAEATLGADVLFVHALQAGQTNGALLFDGMGDDGPSFTAESGRRG